MDANQAVALASAIAAVGIVFDAVEFLWSREEVLDRFFDTRIVRSRYYILVNRPLRRFLFDVLSSPQVFLGAVIAHGVAAVLFPLAVLRSHWLAGMLALVVLSVHCATNIRLCVGRDGADQMQNILWAGFLGYCLPISDAGRVIWLAFIAMQLVLSYWTAGIAKAASAVWRNGSAVHLITRMETYCPPGVAEACRRPAVSAAFSWLTLAFEIGSPFLLLGGRTGGLIFIALAAVFHLGIALTMGLTTFVFAFGAALPIVYYLTAVFPM